MNHNYNNDGCDAGQNKFRLITIVGVVRHPTYMCFGLIFSPKLTFKFKIIVIWLNKYTKYLSWMAGKHSWVLIFCVEFWELKKVPDSFFGYNCNLSFKNWSLEKETLFLFSCQLEIDHVTQKPKETSESTCGGPKSISQGKTFFYYREPLFSLKGRCFHYRNFPVNLCTPLGLQCGTTTKFQHIKWGPW